MNPKTAALGKVRAAHEILQQLQDSLKVELESFAQVCREAYSEGVNDREMAEATGYSRARIQQFRKGDPRKRNEPNA